MDARLEDSLAAALGARVLKARPLTGGDINQAFEVGLADGRLVFVKSNVSAPNDMFVAEARGLAMAQATEHSRARKWDLGMERDSQ